MSADPHPFLATYYSLCNGIAAEFARGVAVHGEKIHCQKGCDACCSQLFQITEPEAAVIARHVEALPQAERRALREKARPYLRERDPIFREAGGREAWGTPPPPGAKLPCPALRDGACSIYEARPLMCRRYGVPIFNPDLPDRVLACELNFAPGEAIVDPALIPNQTAQHEAAKGWQRAWNEAGGVRDDAPFTVGRAIVEGPVPPLPKGAGGG
jgi:Fe-S-cluster containining protein